jgi:UDP-glucose 4-epimerase
MREPLHFHGRIFLMRYLVTGGAGFIGSHLSEALLSQGHEVVVIDDLSTGQIRNIEPLKGRPRFCYFIESIKNRPLLYEIMDGCDVVFHLAAAVGVRLIIESPVRTIETNINGTELVLECASRKSKTVVIASTSEVYGKANKIPFSEDDDLVLGSPKKGRWSYACSKAVDEFLGLAYWKEKKVPVVIVRLFNTVGPRQTGRYGMVLPSFVRQAINGEPITVYGDGTQSRSFTWVGDAVGAMISLSHHPKAVGEIFNIGSSTEISIRELAEMVKDITGSCSEIVFIPYAQAYEEGFEDMRRRVPDIRKIQNLTGYKPTKELREIIKDIFHGFSGKSLGSPEGPKEEKNFA